MNDRFRLTYLLLRVLEGFLFASIWYVMDSRLPWEGSWRACAWLIVYNFVIATRRNFQDATYHFQRSTANTKLIEELLAALKDCLASGEDANWDIVRAAIAKAEGALP